MTQVLTPMLGSITPAMGPLKFSCIGPNANTTTSACVNDTSNSSSSGVLVLLSNTKAGPGLKTLTQNNTATKHGENEDYHTENSELD